MTRLRHRRGRLLFAALLLASLAPSAAEAGNPFRRRTRELVPTSAAVVDRPDTPYMGTFYPTPVMTVRGNSPASVGYSPLGQYGDMTMSLYGPLSSLRNASAPIVTYDRGYDGRTVIREGTSFSTPNLPEVTPVIYPTRATYYYGFRESGDPPWWTNGSNWIDQN